MEYTLEHATMLCLDRDARRCRHCGSPDDLNAYQLVEREGALEFHLSNLVTRCAQCQSEYLNIKKNGHDNRVGVVLCGGRGTRLYPLTMYQNKHTLPIGLTPMVFYPIKTLRRFNVKRVLIVTDREGAGEIMKMLGSGKEFGMDFTYKIQEGAGGISEALYLAKDFANPGDEIVCILGDNIFDLDTLDTDVSFNYGVIGDDNDACVWLKQVDNPQEYGVARIEDGRVVEIIEKPSEPVSDLAVIGLYMYSYDVFRVIESVSPSDRGELEISSVNDDYAKRGVLTYRTVSGYWGDAGGSIQRYAECNMHGAKQANISAEEIDEFRSIVFDDK